MIVIESIVFYSILYTYNILRHLTNNLSNTVILLAPSFSIGIKGIEPFFK